MTGYILPEMISENSLPILSLFLLICNIIPIYYNSHQPWTPARTRSYLNITLKIYFFATMIYVLLCIFFANTIFTKPGSRFDAAIKLMRECAYRYKENDCGNQQTGFFMRIWRMSVEKECFALAMCLRRQVFLLKIHAFLMELWAQVLADASTFVVLVGVYVALTFSSGAWTALMDSKLPIVNNLHTASITQLQSALVEADFKEVPLGIQHQTRPLERVTSIQRSPEDVYLPTLRQRHSLGRSRRITRRSPLARNPVIGG